MLTPEKIAAMDAASGLKTTMPSASENLATSRADEIRALAAAAVEKQNQTLQPDQVFTDPLQNIAKGKSADNVEIAKGAGKQALADVAQAGAQNAGPVGAEMKKNAKGFFDPLEQVTKLSNALQKKGAILTSEAEAVAPIVEAPRLVKTLVKKGVDAIKDTSLTAGVLKEKGALTPEKAQATAWKDMMPKATDKNIQAYRGKGETNPKTLTKGVTFNPTAADKKVLDHVVPLYEDGTIKPKMSTEEKLAAVEGHSREATTAVDNYIADNNKVVTISSRHPEFNTLDKALTSAKAGNEVLFAGDKTVEGAYDAVTTAFKKGLTKGTTDTTDLVSLRSRLKEFDAEMQSKFPNVYKNARTGEMTPTDNARHNAIRDIHTTVRDLISETLPKNNPYKPMLEKISSLIRAGEMINEGASNTSKIESWLKLIKEHPYFSTFAAWETAKHTVAPGLPGL